MKIAAAYVRVSTEEQTELSPDSQVKLIREYAKKNGYIVPKEFIFHDDGISGRSTAKRQGFNQMIGTAKLKPKPFDAILLWKFSRFARNREDSIVYKSMLLAEEVKRGMTEKFGRGLKVSGPPLGYDMKNGEFVVKEQGAEIVRRIFDMYVNQDMGYLNIARELNAEGIRTLHGNDFETRTIAYIIRNPVYIGMQRWTPGGGGSKGHYRSAVADKVVITQAHHPAIIDKEIFEKTWFKEDEIKSRLHETAYLNPELTIIYEDKRVTPEEQEVYHEPDGLAGFIRDLNRNKETLHDIVCFKGESEGITVEGAFQYVNEFHENVLGFCNNIYNAEGGTHITGFKSAFTSIMNAYAREIGILKEKDGNFTGADIRNGMTAVISIKHPDPRFEGQTKTKLDNQDAARATGKIVNEEVVRYFDKNLDTLKVVLSCAEKAAKIRKTEEKARTNLLTKQKFSFDSNGKLANCESRNADICEIFIVEGDSAGGSAKTARNRHFQAILPIRGKILNVEKASIDKVLANAEIKTMINAFGCGFSEGYGNDFDISKLRYNKIIIMADADVDGAHISTLLLTLFYRFMPELIFEGHVYIAMPPLYKAMPSKGREEYLYDDKALEQYRKTHKGNFTLQRYKGLGEMDAAQLWETTLNPETRILKKVEIEDARIASDITGLLMGPDVPPRKAFIYKHAHDAELDI